MELYLITGFLGAGKTTFLKNFVRLFMGKKVFLLINEFGKVGVDGELLREMDAAMAEISNGSIFCACRLDKFEEVLDDLVIQKPDVVLVEASGLSDPTSVRKVLGAERYQEIDYKGSVCLIDAVRFAAVRETARVCPKQVAVSSLALLNKCDLADEEKIAATEEAVREINPAISVKRTQFGAFDPAWLEAIIPQADIDGAIHKADITLQKACLHISAEMSAEKLRAMLEMLAEDTWRMKGFVQLKEGIFLADCVGPLVNLEPYEGAAPEESGKLVLLAGRGMPLRKAVKQAKELYPEYIEKIEW